METYVTKMMTWYSKPVCRFGQTSCPGKIYMYTLKHVQTNHSMRINWNWKLCHVIQLIWKCIVTFRDFNVLLVVLKHFDKDWSEKLTWSSCCFVVCYYLLNETPCFVGRPCDRTVELNHVPGNVSPMSSCMEARGCPSYSWSGNPRRSWPTPPSASTPPTTSPNRSSPRWTGFSPSSGLTSSPGERGISEKTHIMHL